MVLSTNAPAQKLSTLSETVRVLANRDGDTVAVAAIDLASGDMLLLSADLQFHAASTMKVPVLIEVARRVDAGEFTWDDSILVRNEFASIVDGSPYRLDPADDSDSTVYLLIDHRTTIRHLAERMIERSSNLATNLLMALVGPARVNQTAHRLGADSIAVLRGVEDQKAYDRGMSNTTTARDLATLLRAIEEGQAASPAGTREILRILSAQEFNDRIPAGLPPGTRVAHKTGEITRIAHDAAIIYPPGRPPIILVILTRGYENPEQSAKVMSDIARVIYGAIVQNPPGN
ncbi:MAG: serine hydrolase [Gemmatimonadota bacterium]